MYVPAAFAAPTADDAGELLAQCASYPFATLVSFAAAASSSAGGAEGVVVSHLPLLVDVPRRVLRGHLARENLQYEHLLAGAEALVIFHGPHAYVSPSAYVAPGPSVPTWNYVVVHVHGHARVVGEPELRVILSDMIARFDTTGWELTDDEPYLAKSLGAIAGFEIAIERLEGKWKLSQNRSPEDRQGVADWLEGQGEGSREVAALMRKRP
jgi:transcriptional regulator